MRTNSLVIVEWSSLAGCRWFKIRIAALRTFVMTQIMHIFLNTMVGLTMKSLPNMPHIWEIARFSDASPIRRIAPISELYFPYVFCEYP